MTIITTVAVALILRPNLDTMKTVVALAVACLLTPLLGGVKDLLLIKMQSQ
jgi:hypothetical protein